MSTPATTSRPAPAGTASHPSLSSAEREALILRCRPLVKIVVARMSAQFPAHADREELESVGMLGLVEAAARFDPSRGYTFETYASIRVRGAVLDELRKLDLLPRTLRAKARKIQQTVERLEQKLGRVPTDGEIATALGVTVRQYQKVQARIEALRLVHLDQRDDQQERNWHEVIADPDSEAGFTAVENRELIACVAERLGDLPAQQQKVLALYFFEGLRLAEIGRIMGVSEARVSQIRSRALDTLRRYVRRMTY